MCMGVRKRGVIYLVGEEVRVARCVLQDVCMGVMEERCDIFSRGGG